MNNIFMAPKRPLPGATDEIINKYNEKIQRIEDSFKPEEEKTLSEHKLVEQKNHYIAIIVVLIILFLIILSSFNTKPPCANGDYECQQMYDDSKMFAPTGGR